MNLQDYKTPETDAAWEFSSASDRGLNMLEKSLHLERRLAACHEVLNRIVNESLTPEQIEGIAEKALTTTKP